MDKMQKIEKMEKELAELKAEFMQDDWQWHPSNGEWQVLGNGKVIYYPEADGEYALNGSKFKTKKAAQKSAKAYRQYHRLYKLAEELNEGWEPDWSNESRNKYYIQRDHWNRNFILLSARTLNSVSMVYFKSKETAQKAIDLIENHNALGDSND